jgi:hypothetical protein
MLKTTKFSPCSQVKLRGNPVQKRTIGFLDSGCVVANPEILVHPAHAPGNRQIRSARNRLTDPRPSRFLKGSLGKAIHPMRKTLLLLTLLLAAPLLPAAPPAAPSVWKAKVAAELPLLGHRNWILIVDSAYPLQTSPGVETIETNASQIDVIRYVLHAVNGSIHVRPEITMDAELPFVPDADAPGASAYRAQIAAVLKGYSVQSQLHDKIIAAIGETGSQFHVLVLKTTLAVPYSSVFIRLNCKYWGDDAEQRMRVKMAAAGVSASQ